MEILDKLLKEYGRDLFIKLREPVFFIQNIITNPMKITLTPYQEEWINTIHQNKKVSISAFRSSGKTESVLVDYPIYRAYTQKNFMGVVISDSLKQSLEVIRNIKERIVSNEVLSTSIPSNRLASWSKTEIELKNGSRLISRPYTDRIRGIHVDFVGCDEVGEYQNHDVFLGAILPIVTAKDGSVVAVGTYKHSIDLLHKLKENPEWKSLYYPANLPYKGKTLWEWRYPGKSLMQVKKEIGNNIMFSREYLLKVMSVDTQLFPAEIIIPSFDYTDTFIDAPRPGCIYYVSLDFALSGKSGADFSVYVVFEIDKQGVVKIVRIERYKGLSYIAQKKRIQELYNIFKPVKCVADEGSFGKSFIQDMRAIGIPLIGFNFQTRRRELLEVFRGAFDLNFDEGVELPKEKKKFLICKNKEDFITTQLTDLLLKELEAFNVVFKTKQKGDITGRIEFESTEPHDDLVMASAMGYWYARGSIGGTTHVRRGSSYQRSGLLIRSTN